MNLFHKTLMAIGLWLLAVGGRAQTGASFCPTDFEDSPIYVPMHPNEANPLAGGEFSFDCQILMDSFQVERPLFSNLHAGSPYFLSFSVTADNRLVFTYCTAKTDPETFEITENTSRVISDPNVVKTRVWASVSMAHTNLRTSFWVNGELIPTGGLWTGPGPAVIEKSPWMIGGYKLGERQRALPFRGCMDDVRLWRGDMTDFYVQKMDETKADHGQLLFHFDMESFKRGLAIDDQILENRSTAEGRFLNGELVGLKNNSSPYGQTEAFEKKYIKPRFAIADGEVLAIATVFFIALLMIFIIWWVSRAAPGVTYYSNNLPNEPVIDGQPVAEKQPELPIEFGQLWPGERPEFVVHTGSPLPWWRLLVMAGQVAFMLFVMRGMWADAFQKVLSEDEASQMSGIFSVVFMFAVMLAFLWLYNQKHWPELLHLFRGKRTVVGTTERLIIGNPDGANRTIFWEQIRAVETDEVTSGLKFELRSGPHPIESFVPEIFWLTDLADPSEVLIRSKMLIASKPVFHTGEDSLDFHPKMTAGGPKAWFGPCELHETLLFSAHDFFGKNQLLMLRSRIKSAVVEPYDIPKPGWAVVLFLENGVRFPLFFTENLKEAKGAAKWFR